MIKGELLGVEQLARALGAAGPAFLARMRQGMTVAASGLRNHIAFNKLSGQVLRNVTGHLRAFLFWKVETKGDAVEGQVYETMKYGKVHEYGMTIHAVRAKYLRWVGPDGLPRFAKKVVIPPRPFMRPGYEERKESIVATLAEAGALAAKDLAAKRG